MKIFIIFLIVSTCHGVFSYYSQKRQSFHHNNFINPVESYIGPSSYENSPSYTTSDINDYPSIGNYGQYLDMKNPQISSSYSSFGHSESSKEFGSTSYTNYPPQTVHEQLIIHDETPSSNNKPSTSTFFTSNQTPEQSSYLNAIKSIFPSHEFPNAQSSLPENFSSLFSSSFDNLAGGGSNFPSTNNEEHVISQHVEVTKPVVVPVYKKFPYPQPKHFPVAIPHPVLVPVPAPYPVNVLISEPLAIPVIKEIRVPVEREVMYPVDKNIPVEVEKPVRFEVEKHYAVYVPRPYPVKIPIVKTIIHKTPKKWSRDQAQEKISAVNKTILKKWNMQQSRQRFY